MSDAVLEILWYYWSAIGLQPATRNTIGPDPSNRIFGADT